MKNTTLPVYSAETLTALRHRLPEYLTSRGVELRKNGSRLVAKCPVHNDSNPSLAVYGGHHENAGCYPCGFTGDVFDVAQWMGRASTFHEAVQDVAAAVGYCLPHATAGRPTMAATAPQRPARQSAPPFVLSAADKEKIRVARLAFSDAFHGGDEIIDRIAASLGFDRETLRHGSWGESGLGLAEGWLCYAYPEGLKWRNPDPNGKPRFRWIVGKAVLPWRMEWVKPDTRTVYISEGESDCLAMIAAGLEADGNAVCIASPGTSFSREWVPLFAGKKVVLTFDLDPAGQAAAAKVAGMLAGIASEILIWKGTHKQ